MGTECETRIFILPKEAALRYDEDFYARYFPARLEQSKRFRFEDDRLRSLTAAVLLYEVLGLDESKIVIRSGGKPASPSLQMDFNLSHSGNYAALAYSAAKVGVDIEPRELRHVSVASSVFRSEEIEWMNEKPEERFTDLWTMKEAASKCLGLGLSLSFRKFSVLPMFNGDSVSVNSSVLFGRSRPFPGYSLAVCTEGVQSKISVEMLS